MQSPLHSLRQQSCILVDSYLIIIQKAGQSVTSPLKIGKLNLGSFACMAKDVIEAAKDVIEAAKDVIEAAVSTPVVAAGAGFA
uniref:Uncharacterized protein n=1 Tax=Amphimedon queenslandica TaxID=400682 RepID=A0A1X7VEY3_AMPQE